MDQRILIKIAFEDGLSASESYQNSVGRYGQDILSCRTMIYWRRELREGRKDAEDIHRDARLPNFGVRLHVERVLEECPNGSICRLADITGYEPSTVFSIMTQVVYLTFRHWRWVSHSLSEPQKVALFEGARMLEAEQNWDLFWTGDESWILWDNQRSGSWFEIDQELPARSSRRSKLRNRCRQFSFIPATSWLPMCSSKVSHSTQHTS
jgi:hypothetical protein